MFLISFRSYSVLLFVIARTGTRATLIPADPLRSGSVAESSSDFVVLDDAYDYNIVGEIDPIFTKSFSHTSKKSAS